MLKKNLIIFLVSMVPLIELRCGMPMAVAMDLPYIPALIVCAFGNMLPVPIIYLFARKVLLWGMDKPYIGKFFTYCVEKGERGGQKLVKKAGRGGLFVAGGQLPGHGLEIHHRSSVSGGADRRCDYGHWQYRRFRRTGLLMKG